MKPLHIAHSGVNREEEEREGRENGGVDVFILS
jgi:hypothetical protein